MSFLIDESVGGSIINMLRNENFKLTSILETSPGITDQSVLDIARKNNHILITEDKDFGEWVFSNGVRDVSVIFLRYTPDYLQTVVQYLVQFLSTIDLQSLKFSPEFITINQNKVRRRKI